MNTDSAPQNPRPFEPAPWELIPDLGLYMDQVVTFIARTYAPLYGEGAQNLISPSMINNYVKGRLIPRPAGKKYSRDQIALLTMIVALKQVCSMEDIRRMLAPAAQEGAEPLYTAFRQRYSTALQAMRSGERVDFGELRTALDLAILSSAFSAGAAAALKEETAVPASEA